MAQRRAFLPGGNALSRPRLSARRLDRSGDRSEVLYHSLKPVYSISFSEGIKEPEQTRLRRFAGTSIEKISRKSLFANLFRGSFVIPSQHFTAAAYGWYEKYPSKKALGEIRRLWYTECGGFSSEHPYLPGFPPDSCIWRNYPGLFFAVGISGQTRPGTDSAVSFGEIPAFLSKNATNSLLRGYYK